MLKRKTIFIIVFTLFLQLIVPVESILGENEINSEVNFGNSKNEVSEEYLNITLNIAKENNALKISWTSIQTEDKTVSYIVYRDNQQIISTKLPAYLDMEVTEGKTYEYVVNAISSTGKILGKSNVVTVTLDKGKDNLSQINLDLKDYTDSSVELIWNVIEPSTIKYEVYCNEVMIDEVQGSSYIVSSLEPDTDYKFYIKTKSDTSITSTKSNTVSVKTKSKEIDYVDPMIYRTNRFIVKYKNDTADSKSIIGDLFEKSKKIKTNKNVFEQITLKSKIKPEEFQTYCRSNENIEYVQPDYELTIATYDEHFEEQWGLLYEDGNSEFPYEFEKYMYNQNELCFGADVSAAWNRSLGENSIIAVLDTGIDITHEDLRESIWVNADEVSGNGLDDDNNGFIDDYNGWNFVDKSNIVHNQDLVNDEWHGTHIAGIIAASQNNDIGISGIAPSARVMPLKVFKNGVAYTSDIIEAIEYASASGAKIINCSWGSNDDNPALKDTIADNEDILFVCAAGNSYRNIDNNKVYPAAYDNANIISVASINKDGTLSKFSNYGLNSVDVAAPGEDIISTLPGNRYYTFSGTSMSAAFVSGQAALLKATDVNMDALQIKERILASSDRLSSLEGKVNNSRKINVKNSIQSNINYGYTTQVRKYYEMADENTTSSDNSYSLFTTGVWTSRASYPFIVGGIRAASIDGKVYALGGWLTNKMFQYDPSTDAWTEKASMAGPRTGHAVAALNGKLYVFGGYNGNNLINTVEEYDPSTNTWTTKANMPVARDAICASALNGIIYVIAGYDGVNALNSVDAFDPIANTWSTKASIPTPRRMAKSVVLNDKIYVAGGWYVDKLEVYNPATNTWTTKASMSFARAEAGIETVNNRIYAIGGVYGTSQSSAEVYNPDTDTWTESESIPTPNNDFATAVANSKIYCIGGAKQGVALNTLYEFAPLSQPDDYGNNYRDASTILLNTNMAGNIDYNGDVDFYKCTYASITKLNFESFGSTDTYGYLFDENNNLLISDDDSGEASNFKFQYDLEANKTYYLEIKHSNTNSTGAYQLNVKKIYPFQIENIKASSELSSVTLSWGEINNVTGYDVEVNGVVINNGFSNSYLHTGLTQDLCYSYRIRAKFIDGISNWSPYIFSTTKGSKWTYKSPMYMARDELRSVTLNGKIYIIGGCSNTYGNALSIMQIYNPDNDSYTTKKGMNTPRRNFGAVEVNGKIYVMGGINSYSEYCNSVEMYDPLSDSWTTKANMPIAKSGFGIAVLNGSIYVIGGSYIDSYGNQQASNTVEVYDTTNNIWTSKKNMTTARYNLGAAVLNGKIVAVGGARIVNSVVEVLNVTEEYNPSKNTWSNKSNMLNPRSSFGITVFNDKIVVIGGIGSTSTSINQVEEYSSNGWSSKENLPLYIGYNTSSSLNGRLYNIGGFNGMYGSINSISEYRTTGLPASPSLTNMLSSATSITVSWNSVVSATGYDIEVDGIVLNNGNGTSYVHSNLSQPNIHTYRVRAKNSTGVSDWSQLIKGTVSGFLSFNSLQGETYDVQFKLSNIMANYSTYKLIISFNANELDIFDACSKTTPQDLSVGNIQGTNITIADITPSSLVLYITNPTDPKSSWTGILDTVKFVSKTSGVIGITYTVQ